MTKKEIVKEITERMDAAQAMVRIDKLNITVRDYPYGPVYGIIYKYGVMFFARNPRDYRGEVIISPVKWDKFTKKDLLEIYERATKTYVKNYSRKTDSGYDFFKIWE